jgi:NADH:ubiquinone oxidoreductase subunit 4 (subunit M)
MTPRELAIAAPLLGFAIVFGVYPQAIFRYLTPSVNKEVGELADWTRNVKQPRIEAAEDLSELALADGQR